MILPTMSKCLFLLAILSLSCRPAPLPVTEKEVSATNGAKTSAGPIVVFTEGAVKQVFRYRDIHKLSGKWRLRVEVIELSKDKCRHLVDLDVDPTRPEDFEYDFQGIRVVVSKSQIDRLRGSSVGYRKLDDGTEGFFVRNPNYRESAD